MAAKIHVKRTSSMEPNKNRVSRRRVIIRCSRRDDPYRDLSIFYKQPALLRYAGRIYIICMTPSKLLLKMNVAYLAEDDFCGNCQTADGLGSCPALEQIHAAKCLPEGLAAERRTDRSAAP